MSALGGLLPELRRRRVPQVALAYVAFVFVALQGGQVLFETLDVPRWAMRLLLALLMLGFPVVVLLTWLFELTPAGLRRDSGERRLGERRTPLELIPDKAATASRFWWLAGSIGLLMALAIATWFWWYRSSAPLRPSEASIAVLPFTSLSKNVDDSYFAEGLAVELQDALAGVQGLKVAARTSALAKRNRDLDVKQLGTTLGVATVLDASVRREGSRVRISARLSDTRTGFTLWAHSYERDQSDVFALQSEVATEVVRALRGVLPNDQHLLVKRLAPTTNINAYDAYLKGQQLLRQPSTEAGLTQAIGYFGDAVAADAGFARAQAGICQAQVSRFENSGSSDAFELARVACQRAQKMDSGLSEVSLALADLNRIHGDPDKAIEYYLKAETDPARRPDAYVGMARVYAAQGKQDRALQFFDRALELRPGDAVIHARIGYHYFLAGDLPKAIAAYRKATELRPDDAVLWSYLGGVYLTAGNNADAARALARSIAIKPDAAALNNLGDLEYQAGKYADAADLYRTATVLDPADFLYWGGLGDALLADPGNAAQARAAFREAAARAQRYVEIKSGDAKALAALGWYSANLAQASRAREMVRRSEALAGEPSEVALFNAQTLVLLGDIGQARRRVAAARVAGMVENRITTNAILRRADIIMPVTGAIRAGSPAPSDREGHPPGG